MAIGASTSGFTRERGLAPQRPAANWTVFAVYMFGVLPIISALVSVKGFYQKLN
jgi:nitrate reductase NapE component